MHEMSIVEALIEQTQREIERAGGQGTLGRGRVVRLDLTIGRLSGVCCDSIRFGFEVLSAGTPLQNAEVYIHEPKARCQCHACGAGVEIEEFAAQCPRCGNADVSIEGGRELMLDSIELED